MVLLQMLHLALILCKLSLNIYEDLPLDYFQDELVFENEIYVGVLFTFDEYCGRSDYP